MISLIYSETHEGSVVQRLGMSEYSYYFVLKEFRPLLERLGPVIPVTDPERQVDAIYRSCLAHGEDCVFYSFAPPHRTLLGLECPTVPVFAWEFDTLPDEVWDNEPRNDWRLTLSHYGRALTHSAFAVETTRQTMGDDFPVASIPAPVWDRFSPLYRPLKGGVSRPFELDVRGRVLDTRALDLDVYSSALRRVHGYAPLPRKAGPDEPPVTVRLGGVVYTAVMNPGDGRKNWFDMVGGFCCVFRDTPDATLVIKITRRESDDSASSLLEELSKHAPFSCRVVLIDGFLAEEGYERLADGTTYTINTSHGEGQCLPLMEYMSAGKPAVSPVHTAMADYIDDSNSFVVASQREPTQWPHDTRRGYRTRRHRIDFGSLMAAYCESYRVAVKDPARYASMSAEAHERLRQHCSLDTAEERLRQFLALGRRRRVDKMASVMAAQ